MKKEITSGLEGMDIWKQAIAFSIHVCKNILPTFPSEEKWALKQQLNRAVQSIPANIAEGYGRFYFQETIRYSYIARGSLEETYSHLVLAEKLGYLRPEAFEDLEKQIVRIKQLINGYIAFLKKSKIGLNEPGNNFSPKISENLEDIYSTESESTNHESQITNHEEESDQL